MLTDIAQATLASCHGIIFTTHDTCPHCNGELAGYDVKTRLFAVILTGDEEQAIHVLVKRFRCRNCRQISLADQPFYPRTRIGSPVVDLCSTLAETMHIPRVSACLEDMGIVVDRWSVRNYVQRNRYPVPAAEMFGIRVPLSVISLSSLAMGFPEGRGIDTAAFLAACGYPSRKWNAGPPPQDKKNDLQ
jgi:hypothetical protein